MDSYEKKLELQSKVHSCLLNQMVFSNIELESNIEKLETILNRQNLLSFSLDSNEDDLVLNQLSNGIRNNSFLILLLLQNQQIWVDEYLSLSKDKLERRRLHG